MADLSEIKPPSVSPPETPDPLVAQESASEQEDATAALDARRKTAEIASIEQDTEAREKYANRIYCLAVGWLIAVLIIVLVQGFNLFGWTNLPQGVMIALVAGSTTGVLGILASVIAYIFRSPKQ